MKEKRNSKRDEYDFSKGIRGQCAQRSAEGTNVVVLAGADQPCPPAPRQEEEAMTVLPVVSPGEAPGDPIDLGPDLPMPAFTSSERWHPERIGALAVYCSDGRWGEAFDEFCHRHLQIPRYDRLALAGGPACLVAGEEQHDLGRAIREQLDFLVRVHELEQIV